MVARMDVYSPALMFIFGYILCLVSSFGAFGAPGNLTLVQIIHRHGDRTPERTFPSDPNLDKLLDLGLGELTNVGKQQQYELGVFLRSRYSSFANQKYASKHIKCESSDFDRTIMSAYCVLAGLYPPVGDQVWKAGMTWQPIPVHMVPSPLDYMLVVNKNCELRKNITDEARVHLNKKNKSLYHTLTNVTGMNVTDADDVRIIYEAVDFAAKMNWTVPTWATRSLMKKMDKVALQGFNIMLPDKLSQKLASGILLKNIVSNMENKTTFEDLDGQQFYTYTTHDTVLYGFLTLLDMYNGKKPPINSAIIIELYVDANYTYSVQILYRNSTTVEPYVLVPLNCTTAPYCSWQEFINLTSSLIPTNIFDECKPRTVFSTNTFHPNAGGVSIVVAGLAAVTVAVLGISIYKTQAVKKRRGYNRI